MARSKRGLGLALALAAAVLAVDQASQVARAARGAATCRGMLAGGLRIELNHNPGISFSQLSSAGDIVIALVATVCAGVAVALWLAPAALQAGRSA